jgi:D-alanyl-D-alanine carboxypeptidase
MHLASGDVLTIENLLYAAICGSYNDAFHVLGVLIAGSTQNFINQMNDRAAACGATDTTYAVDISGYRDASVTTAEDTARIALIAAQNELYVKIASASSYRKNGLSIDNRNALISGKETNLYYNAKCRGMSAGYTNRAGNCVVSLYESNGGHYVGVVLGGADGDDGTNHAYALSNSLIRWVDKTYTYLEILSPDTVICTLPVTVSDLTSEIEVKARESIRYFLPADCEVGKDVIYSLRLSYTSLEAPVTEGIPVGYVAILYQGKVIGSATLYTAGSAERSSFVSSLNAMQDLIKSRRFLAGAIFFVVVTTAWLTTEALLLRRRRHRWDKYFSEKLEAPERMARKKPSQPKAQSRPNGK